MKSSALERRRLLRRDRLRGRGIEGDGFYGGVFYPGVGGRGRRRGIRHRGGRQSRRFTLGRFADVTRGQGPGAEPGDQDSGQPGEASLSISPKRSSPPFRASHIMALVFMAATVRRETDQPVRRNAKSRAGFTPHGF